jgi:tagaturonate reductase
MTNLQMWGQDLIEIPGFEAATVANLKLIRTEGAMAAFRNCL